MKFVKDLALGIGLISVGIAVSTSICGALLASAIAYAVLIVSGIVYVYLDEFLR